MSSAFVFFVYLTLLQIKKIVSLRIVDDKVGGFSDVKSAAIFVQMHNASHWPELRQCIEHVADAGRAHHRQGFSVALFLSSTAKHEEISRDVQKLRESSGLAEAYFTVVSNSGADIGQFLQQIQLIEPTTYYDILLKIHSKSDEEWRHLQLDSLCGTAFQVADIFSKFEKQAEIGMIGPPTLTWTRDTTRLESFRGLSKAFLYPGTKEIQKAYNMIYPHERLHKGQYRLVAGSMFWSRYALLVTNTNLRAAIPEMLPLLPSGHEQGGDCSKDHSRGCYIMHSLERVFPTMVKAHYGLEVISSQ